MVDEAAGGGDDDLDAAPEVVDLGPLGDAAVDDGVLDLGGGPELVALLLDLDGELAGGGKDQDDGSVSRLKVRL